MAGYRQFHTQFWKDEYLIELDPLERYLFSYLFTNDLSSISGIYKLPRRVIQNETGLELGFIDDAMRKFQDAKKIFYQDGVMWVVNMRKYHKNASPRTMAKVNSDVSEIPDCPVKTAYLYYEKTGEYCINTVSIPRSEIVNESLNVNENESENSGNDSADGAEILSMDYAELVTVYEANIGPLSSIISETLEDDLKTYGLAWCKEAIAEAVKNNVRKWSYVQGILSRWRVRGHTSTAGNGKSSIPGKNGKPKRYEEVWENGERKLREVDA